MVSFFNGIHSIKAFHRLAIITIIAIYLVILAGIFVRVTGSGMGCPDWPKCYGLVIPPTHIDQLTWYPAKEYSQGQMIIKETQNTYSLFKSKNSFTSSLEWDYLNWEEISDSKHDYSVFSPIKTWIEYLNRCLGAISGILIFTLFIISFFSKKIPINLFSCSLFLICLSLIQYWLGRDVVYSVLESQKITIHFFVALMFIPVLFFLIYKSNYLFQKNSIINYKNEKSFTESKYSILFKKYVWIFLFLALISSLIQIFLGTQVRGRVEENLMTALGAIELTFHKLCVPFIFLINMVLIIGFWKFFKNKINGQNIQLEILGLMFILCLLIFTGSWMYVFELSKSVQPTWTTLIHAYSAVMLFSIYISLLCKRVIYNKLM